MSEQLLSSNNLLKIISYKFRFFFQFQPLWKKSQQKDLIGLFKIPSVENLVPYLAKEWILWGPVYGPKRQLAETPIGRPLRAIKQTNFPQDPSLKAIISGRSFVLTGHFKSVFCFIFHYNMKHELKACTTLRITPYYFI